MDNPYEYYFNSIRNLTEKMTPSDYFYLSEKIWEYQARIEEIKNR